MEEDENDFVVEMERHCFMCLEEVVDVPASGISTHSFQYIRYHLGMDMTKVFRGEMSVPEELKEKVQKSRLKVSMCEACGDLASKFSKKFKELEVIKMEVEAELGNVYDRMVRAENERLEEYLKKTKEDGAGVDFEEITIVDIVRKEAIEKCSRKLRTSKVLPRVKLDRCKWKANRISRNRNVFGNALECGICHEEFRNSSHLTRHCIKRHPGQGQPTRHVVEIPRRSSSSKYAPKVIIQDYTLEADEFKCNICGAKLSNKSNFNKHYKRYHLNITKFQCSRCDKRFLYKCHMKEHQNGPNCIRIQEAKENPNAEVDTLHEQEPESENSLTEIEAIIDVVHNDMKTVGKGVRSAVAILPEVEDTAILEVESSADDIMDHRRGGRPAFPLKPTDYSYNRDKGTFKCGVCKVELSSRGNLIKHFKMLHLNIKRFKCSVCNRTFTYKSHFERHVCGGIRRNRDSTSKWQRRNTGSDPTYTPNGLLRKAANTKVGAVDELESEWKNSYMEIETITDVDDTDKDLSEDCSAAAIVSEVRDSTFLKVECSTSNYPEVRKQGGRPPLPLKPTDYTFNPSTGKYKCRICQVEVSRRSNLGKHFKMFHLNLKKFKCTSCSQAFAYKCHLNMHQQFHCGVGVRKHAKAQQKYWAVTNLTCSTCGIRFISKKSLDNHREWAHMGVTWPCGGPCKKRYALQYSLNEHRRLCPIYQRQKRQEAPRIIQVKTEEIEISDLESNARDIVEKAEVSNKTGHIEVIEDTSDTCLLTNLSVSI